MNTLALFGQTSNDMYAVDMSNIATSAVTLGIIMFLVGIAVVAYIIVSYLLSRIFRKAGVAGWKAWVPVYSTWITLELGGQRGWLSLLLLSPIIIDVLPSTPGAEVAVLMLAILTFLASLTATVFLYMAMYKIGLHFGKEDYFVLWAIFLPIVWYAWLAFDQSTWKESAVTAQLEPTAAKNDDTHSSDSTV
jgi:hypothetical protein